MRPYPRSGERVTGRSILMFCTRACVWIAIARDCRSPSLLCPVRSVQLHGASGTAWPGACQRNEHGRAQDRRGPAGARRLPLPAVPPVAPPRPSPPHCRYRPPRPAYPRVPLHRRCVRSGPAWRPQRRPRGALTAAAPRRPGCCDAPSNPAGRRSPDRPELVPRCSGQLSPPRQDPGQPCSRWATSGKLRGALRWRLARDNKTLHHDGNYHRGARSHGEPGG